MKLDKIDKKILWYLHYNARIPLSELAKKVGISKQGLNYRLKQIVENKVITGFMSVIDIHQLGYLTYRVYVRYKAVDKNREQEIVEYLKKHEHVLWLAGLSGTWDLEIVFTAKNFIQFNNMWKKVREELGKYFSKYNISMSVVNYHLNRDYLINKQHTDFSSNYYGFEPKNEKLDELDLSILVELSKNCKQTNVELGEKLKVSYHTIKERIRKLESKKIISSHRVTLDLSKMHRLYYKTALYLNNPTKQQEQEIYYFCSKYNFIVYLVEVLGSWQLEVEAEVENENEFTEFLRELRNKFADLIVDYDSFQVLKEYKLNYFPMGRLS